MNQRSLGFKIKELTELQDWKVVEIDADVPLEIWANCPGGCGPLKTISTITGNAGGQKIRVGCCRECGYVGYMDRPTKEWMNKFYSGIWDNSTAKNIDLAVEKFKGRAAKNNLGRKTEIPFLVEKIKDQLDKNRYICEIGCGFGHNLRQLELQGFKKVIGLEASLHRAEIARRVYGFNIFTAPFENLDLQKELLGKAPFSLIFAYHVLEHTYDPGRVVELISNLQKPGDYLMFSVPNAKGEVSMATLIFLPHLHAFSPECLEKILNNQGYEVVDKSLTNGRLINFTARKKDYSIKAKIENVENAGGEHYEKMLAKFAKGLALDKKYPAGERRLWWFRKFDIGRQAAWDFPASFNKYVYGWGILPEVGWKRYFGVKRRIQSFLVENLDRRFASSDDSPIEIQYDGNIKLFFT